MKWEMDAIMYCRQRSTLRRLNFGPKDGEHHTSLVGGLRLLRKTECDVKMALGIAWQRSRGFRR